MAVTQFVEGLIELYNSGNISRESFDAAFGFDVYEELDKRAAENARLSELKIEEFAPVPFSNQPEKGTTPTKKKKPAPKKKKPNA